MEARLGAVALHGVDHANHRQHDCAWMLDERTRQALAVYVLDRLRFCGAKRPGSRSRGFHECRTILARLALDWQIRRIISVLKLR